MNVRLQPAQKQDHQPGRESEMRPQPDYGRNFPAAAGSRTRWR